ncbi:TetR/AcrR family transcriptional regulator [Pseudarthrobacter sp. MEB009]|uniref:TetR/AcrR family transcriptional regulator n=1 Tax=Pseudarthrobacter sp. MEB009 TaxID=3040326 RepID=UPI0025551CD4|nr:TetR/AcrR family transcriptional regulator [Pseudarthrobacter sp. MEB009]
MGLKASGGSYPTGLRRREKIIDTATRLFGAGGYHATPMSAVAEAVGISEGGLAHHFPSKKVLLQAVAERRLIETASWWEAQPGSESGLAVLDQMVEATRRFTDQPGLIELFVLSISEAADASSPAHARLAGQYNGVVESLVARWQAAVDKGEIRPDVDLELVARECIAVSDGLQIQWVLSNGTVDIVAGVAEFSESLKARLRVP